MTDIVSLIQSSSMRHRTYAAHDGGFWIVYPERVHIKWEEYYENVNMREVEPEPIPKDWTGRYKRPLLSFRFGSTVPFPRPELTDEEKNEIVETATSREDFHDIGRIMGPPGFGTCLCELRFVTGLLCVKHFKKGEDGKTLPEGKSHWAWYIDIRPRGMLCPHAYMNGIRSGGLKFACDILIKAPTEEWVMAQSPYDPVGTVAGRATSDHVLLGKCPQCSGSSVDPDTKQLINPNFNNPLLRPGPAVPQEYELPEDASMWINPGDPPALPWSRNLCVNPLMLDREKDAEGNPLREYHPHFSDRQFYHQQSFVNAHDLIDDRDILYDHHGGVTLAAHKETLAANAQSERDQQEREEQLRRDEDRREMAEIVYETTREDILKRLIAKDTRQWY